ncbi:sodium/glutamate symporter [Barrientosiimonas marina]|uniref:Sodium/glutamate symporter n=1 Tax=Lentibacillus kimchii TaxID=1542911 RepID=A0ABW2UXC2_9BACI
MSVVVAFGLASIMLCIGLVIRVKVPFIRNMLVPTSIIAGILGFIVMNTGFITSTDSNMYINIVNYLFAIMFISLTLTSNNESESEKSGGKNIAKGAIGLGLIWNILYALTPLVGALVIMGIGGFFGMNPIYGLIIPFAFTQGPGQASTFGTVMEQQYGIENAATVGITFAAIGFIICFVIGVPLARLGIKKGMAKNLGSAKIADFIKRGFYTKEEKREELGKETMFSGNIDTMTFHFAIIGLCLIMALLISEAVSYIPAIGSTFSGLLFVYGMFSGYLMKFILKKLGIDYMLDNTFQSKITGWATDYLVVSSFMGVPLSLVGNWMIPIIITSIVVSIFVLAICIFFGQRIGGRNDFERTLGLFGATTGQVHSGLALIRIIDPTFKTTAAIELGLMNLAMMPSFLTVLSIFAISSGTFSWNIGILLILAPVPVYLILLKFLKSLGKKTYTWKTKPESEDENEEIDTFAAK